MKGINIFLADGFEDIEALGTCDVLRRGGLKVNLVGIADDPFVVSSHGVTVGPDFSLSELLEEGPDSADARDFMIFPGGMPGSMSLAGCKPLIRAMKEHYGRGGSLAAICAAPGLVLSQLDGLEGLEFTCFDGFEQALLDKDARFVNAPAVCSRPTGSHAGHIITGRSAGHAVAFGLEILRTIKGDETAEKVRFSMLLGTE